MAEPVPSIDEIVALPLMACKALLIQTLYPTIKNAEAARLAGYKGKAGGNYKARVAGVLGEYLDADGIGLPDVAAIFRDAMSAKRIKEVVLKNKLSTGADKQRQITITQKVEKVDLGPDHKVRMQAGAFLYNVHLTAEKQPKPPERIDAPERSPADLEKAVGRGGPTEVIDAEFDEVSDAASR